MTYKLYIDDLVGAVGSYVAAGWSLLADLPWTGFFGLLLLGARIIVDVPKAWDVIKSWRNRRKWETHV